jgi:choline dehydrogenase-like flavoprotein
VARFASLAELEDGAVLEADVAVVGAGAAGITIARELAGSGLEVLLVESGGLDLDGPTQALYEGESSAGLPYVPLEACRQRFFGGTTNHWTGWCKPLDPVDLAPRPWLGLKGWPLGYDDLKRHYHRAQPLVGLGPFRYDGGLWEEIGEDTDPFDVGRLGLSFWRQPPDVVRFGQAYRADLERAPNVRVLLEANLVEIRPDPGGATVERLELRHLGGRAARVRARAHVLACGGIENARLLLASDAVLPAGVGNARDLVGRHFTDHAVFTLGEIFPADAYAFVDRYHRRVVGGELVMPGWSLAPAAQQRHGLANGCVVAFVDRVDGPLAPAAARLWAELGAGELPDRLPARALEVLRDLGDLAESAWRKHALGRYVNRVPARLDLAIFVDPLPNPSSRVTLRRGERDALGLPRARLDRRPTPANTHVAAEHGRIVAAELARLGLARVRLHPALAEESADWMLAGNLEGYDPAPGMPSMHVTQHHMGTTRMAADPREGVVDGDCRVHGIDNLYVAGSSVFATPGHANATLTIVALALRLAEHLKARLAA